MNKPNKKDRINGWILGGAQSRATAFVSAYLSKNSMALKGVEDFDAAMQAITEALARAYSQAMCDTLDVVEGRPLSVLK